MLVTPSALRQRAGAALTQRKIAEAADIAWACAWLECCGYPGVKLLLEALPDERRSLALSRDALGFDLADVSCVFLAPRILAAVLADGRAFLRNVRHGLYLLPFAVRANIAIGCPVDPAFALGGARARNPYEEKLAQAEAAGIELAEDQWAALAPSPTEQAPGA